MAGSTKVAPEPLVLLRLLMTGFLLGLTIGSSQYRDRTVFLYTTLAGMIVLWFAVRAADGGGWLLRVRGLLERLEVVLSAATCMLFLEPIAGHIIASYRLGCDVSVAAALAAAIVVVVVVVVALALGMLAFVRGRGTARA